jgi:ribosomal-protein-alanine N-acetyltransferase
MDYATLTIETERLKLIPLSNKYKEDVFREFTDEITTYMYPKPNESMEALDKHYEETLEEMKRGEDYSFTVIDKNTEEFLGRGGLHQPHTRNPELGIWLKKSAHGNGYGREAMTAVKKWADENLRYEYIAYPVDKRNIASRKIAESMGGKIMKEYKKINMAGKELDEVEYHIYPSKQIN